MRCASTLQDETLQKGNILRFYCVILQQMLYKTIPAFRNGADCITIPSLPRDMAMSPPLGFNLMLTPLFPLLFFGVWREERNKTK